MSGTDHSKASPVSGEQGPARDPLARLARGRRRYAEEWSGNASTFARDGHYAWMAAFLDGHDPILEIGPGNGFSTVALAARGHVVVAVEENPDCLERAHANLAAAGIDTAHERRELLGVASAGYSARYALPVSVMPEKGVLLVEGDVLNDPGLESWLVERGPFGAVACWLMGTYFEHTQNEAIQRLPVGTPDQYRMRVHEKILRLATRVLRERGIVHVVDRSLLVPDETRALPGSEQWLARAHVAYNELARPCGFQVGSLEMRNYDEPPADAGPSIRMSRSLGGADAELSAKSFMSVRLSQIGDPAAQNARDAL